MLPNLSAHQRQGIATSWLGLVIPDRLANGPLAPLGLLVSQQCHQREQSQQSRCGSQGRQIRPLALGLDAQVFADFVIGDYLSSTLPQTPHLQFSGSQTSNVVPSLVVLLTSIWPP